MKWLIVEDALRDRKGHWLEYVSTFVRGLRALGDDVTVLCDRKAEGFILDQMGVRPVLPDSIWHRMGDRAGALRRYLRAPGHAVATFLAMRKVFRGFNHGLHGLTRMGRKQVNAQGTCAGAAFSNPFTSELARDCENISPTRGASGPAEAMRAETREIGSAGGNQLADSKEFLEVQSRAGLQMDSQKHQSIRAANDPSTSVEFSSSVLIRDIRGSNSVTLDARRSPLNLGAAPDWIFVPTVLVHHLLGWWLLLKTGSVPRKSRVLLFFPNLPIRLDDVGCAYWNAGPTTKLMAWLFTSFRKEVESGRVVLGAETHSMQRALESLIGMRVTYLPHPVEFHAETPRRGGEESPEGLTAEDILASQAGAVLSNSSTSELSRDCENTSLTRSSSAPASLPATSYPSPDTSAKPIVFGCYGAARWEKGSDIFQEAIRLVLDRAISTTKCTKGHEKGKGISTTIERQGGRENEESEFGPKGEGVGMTKSNNLDIHGRGDAGLCLDKPSGAAFSNPSTRELARDSENISPSRSASAPADALRADHTGLGSAGGNQLADSKDFLEGQLQAGLQMDHQKDPTIRTANDPIASGKNSESVSISEICGQNSSSSETSHSALDNSLAATAAGRPLRFAIQWVEDFRDGEGNLVSIDSWLREHTQVEVIGRFFEGDEYQRRLAETDVMVLPYRNPYQLRVSRVVIEAMMNGMPVIATRGTTLFEQAEEYGVVVGCEEGSAESLAEAILKAAENFEMMRVSAMQRSTTAAQSFSVGFFRDLLERK